MSRNGLERKRNRLINYFSDRIPLVLILAAAFALGLATTLATETLRPDEYEILMPALRHIFGMPLPVGKYPSFSFLFYEAIFRVYGLFTDLRASNPLLVARMVNLCLYLFNIYLLYRAASFWVGRQWAGLAAFFFAFAPGVLLSGVYVKTESLLLSGLLLGALAAQRVYRQAENLKWHIVCGLFCGIMISTKYIPILGLVYLGAVLASCPEPLRKAPKNILRIAGGRGFWLFCASSLVAVLCFWPTLWRLYELDFSQLVSVGYMNDSPNALRAVGEGGAFPWGRFSSVMVTFLPLFGAGVAACLSLAGSLLFFRLPKGIWWIWGMPVILYIGAVSMVTLQRVPWVYTLAVPFVSLGAVFFWKDLYEKKRLGLAGILIRNILLAGAVVVTLYQSPLSVRWFDGYVRNYLRAVEHAGLTGSTWTPERHLPLINCALMSGHGVDAQKIAQEVARIRPEYILVFDSLVENYCKYKGNRNWASQCLFFKKLLDEEMGYEVLWKEPIDFPLKSLWGLWDPEASSTMIFLKKATAERADGSPLNYQR